MPSLSHNLSVWGDDYDWSQRGDEWSNDWGGVSHQWWNTLFPRIQGFVPTGRILEIAPGYGRWTHFLRDLCDELIIVDIAESAIAYCRERFAADAHISAYVNDGTSLAIVAEDSIDFVFSFDSLVHAEADIISGYLAELARILTPDGVAFLHHSNMAGHETGTYDPNNIHWRATTVSAELVERLAASRGLSCISQETVAWGNAILLNDCFSVITRAGSAWDRENVRVENLAFSTEEIAMSHRRSTQYPGSRPDIRFGTDATRVARDAHARALELLDNDDATAARNLLREQLQRLIDPEMLNDAAVLAMRCGDLNEAKDLLRALVHLHPGYPEAAQNLASLESAD